MILLAVCLSLFIYPEENLAKMESLNNHPVFDLQEWEKTFDEYNEEHPDKQHGFWSITGPFSVANIEKHRRKLGAELNDQTAVPTDVFVWSVGQPEKPFLTKIGGVPYWPRSSEWPTSKDGKPLNFIAQICFLDSNDLVENLPGDVLLIFTSSKYLIDEECLELRWVTVKDDEPIWSAEESVRGDLSFEVPELYGNIFRTTDYEGYFQRRPKAITDIDRRYDNSELFVYQAVKIGGFPSYIQDVIMGEDERLICQLSCVVPIPGYSFVNLKDLPNPQSSPMSYSKGFALQFGDGGVISVFQSLKDNSKFRLESETH